MQIDAIGLNTILQVITLAKRKNYSVNFADLPDKHLRVKL